MGISVSTIDYKERNFTEQPLEDEEIDILLDALPKENVIDSIETEGREKIVREMSDQKIFNLRGDNVFDYYFTNHKQELKNCMTSHITRDGTPCPDEKFKRMITKIPDLVQGPLREKEIEWDIERTGLESKYNRLNTSNTDLQDKYDTLEKKRQQNFETLALDRFLANPEMYNKMLMGKMSEKALDIFTKDGDIDINVKGFVEHSSIKSTLERAHQEKKTIIPDFIEDFKGQASNLLNGFNKEAADGVKSQMPPLVFLMTLIQMKIAVQYSGLDKTKIVPNRTLYTTFSELFDELGIDIIYDDNFSLFFIYEHNEAFGSGFTQKIHIAIGYLPQKNTNFAFKIEGDDILKSKYIYSKNINGLDIDFYLLNNNGMRPETFDEIALNLRKVF